MVTFKEIRTRAEHRLGGIELEMHLPKVKTPKQLSAVSDDRYLSLMCLRIFRAGLKHSMVDAKWPVFEDVFHGFDPRRVRMMSDEELEACLSNKALIRHWGKLKSVRENAIAMVEQIESGMKSFGGYVADWPGSEVVELWFDIAKRFSQMGGNSGPYFLRMAGKDTFMLTPHVVKALNEWGVFVGSAEGKGNQRKIQAILNEWTEESGAPLAHISMILAQTVD
jgi:3-methyladenine DNA glycosylase Tag